MKPKLLLLLLVLVSYSSDAAVMLYPAPKHEPLSADFQVTIGALPVDVNLLRSGHP